MSPRLGDLLIDAGLLSNEQVAQGLRAQVMWGGRLGTNLIELGYLGIDELSRLLGRQQRYPAALAWHFEHADAALQKQFSPELAECYACLPIARAGEKLIIATAAPIEARGLAAIATDLGTASAHLMPALAAELRVRYFLERVYDLPRETRYLRTRSAPRLPFEPDVERAQKRLATAPDDRQLPMTRPPPPTGEPKRERRRYVQTLGMAQLVGLEPPPRTAKGTSTMVLRRPLPSLGLSLATATRSIRASTDREQVADLVVATLAGFVPTCQAAMLLVVRSDVAMPVGGFRRDGATLPDVAVPLDEPGLVPTAIRESRMLRDHASKLGTVDTALLDALGATGDLVVEPVQIIGHVMSVLVMAARPGEGLASVVSIAMATGAAFSRLMRDAAR